MTPILSIETILSAMMCLCSSSNNSSVGTFSTLEGVNGNKPLPLFQANEVTTVTMKLANIERQLTELKVQQALLLSTSQKYQNKAPQIRLGLQPLQSCPANIVGAPNSIYSIKLWNYEDKFQVLCSGNDDFGIGWMVVQQRLDGSENFLRSWEEYRRGFGLLNGEFFLGLDKLHALTTAKTHELLIILENFEGESRFAKYDRFQIGSEAEEFQLKVLGKYSGTAIDSLTQHLLKKFSTFDRDNDEATGNCAAEYTGAWWYTNCHTSNLNGKYLGGKLGEENYGKGVTWEGFGGQYYSLKTVQMLIRPVA